MVHFHALIRLDGPGNDFAAPTVPITATDLATAIHDAAASVRLTVPIGPVHPTQPERRTAGQGQPGNPEQDLRPGPDPAQPGSARYVHQSVRHQGDTREQTEDQQLPQLEPAPLPRPDTHPPSMPATLTLRFGPQTDTQPINGGPTAELTPERVAAYIAKYATKSAEDFGLGGQRITPATLPYLGLSGHVETTVRTAWELGGTPDYVGLRRWLHMAGFRGHFASKSRRYSTTLGAIRGERRAYRQRQAAEHARQLGDLDDADTTLVVARWKFTGIGYLTSGDAALALSAAARARERREAARDAISPLETERAALP